MNYFQLWRPVQVNWFFSPCIIFNIWRHIQLKNYNYCPVLYRQVKFNSIFTSCFYHIINMMVDDSGQKVRSDEMNDDTNTDHKSTVECSGDQGTGCVGHIRSLHSTNNWHLCFQLKLEHCHCRPATDLTHISHGHSLTTSQDVTSSLTAW